MKVSSSFSKRIIRGALIFVLGISFNVTGATEVTRSLSLEDRVKLLEQQLAAANRLRAEAQFEINALKNEVRDLRGQVEEQGYQLEQIITRQRELYRDIDARLNSGTVPDNTNSGSTSLSSPSVSQPQVVDQQPLNTLPDSSTNTTGQDAVTQGAADQTPGSATPLPAAGDDGRVEYSKIFPLVRSRRFDEAVTSYQQFIESYPNSPYVADSRYWLAQIYVVQNRVEEAEQEYLTVAEQYPQQEKASLAWLKLGNLYEKQGQTDKAQNAYNRVVTLYPDSSAAQMASTALQSLNSGNP